MSNEVANRPLVEYVRRAEHDRLLFSVKVPHGGLNEGILNEDDISEYGARMSILLSLWIEATTNLVLQSIALVPALLHLPWDKKE